MGSLQQAGDAFGPLYLDHREEALPEPRYVPDLGGHVLLALPADPGLPFGLPVDEGVPLEGERLRRLGFETVLEALLGQAVLVGELERADGVAVERGEVVVVHVQRDDVLPQIFHPVDERAHGRRRELHLAVVLEDPGVDQVELADVELPVDVDAVLDGLHALYAEGHRVRLVLRELGHDPVGLRDEAVDHGDDVDGAPVHLQGDHFFVPLDATRSVSSEGSSILSSS